jgi:hypothetical protein
MGLHYQSNSESDFRYERPQSLKIKGIGEIRVSNFGRPAYLPKMAAKT